MYTKVLSLRSLVENLERENREEEWKEKDNRKEKPPAEDSPFGEFVNDSMENSGESEAVVDSSLSKGKENSEEVPKKRRPKEAILLVKKNGNERVFEIEEFQSYYFTDKNYFLEKLKERKTRTEPDRKEMKKLPPVFEGEDYVEEKVLRGLYGEELYRVYFEHPALDRTYMKRIPSEILFLLDRYFSSEDGKKLTRVPPLVVGFFDIEVDEEKNELLSFSLTYHDEKNRGNVLVVALRRFETPHIDRVVRELNEEFPDYTIEFDFVASSEEILGSVSEVISNVGIDVLSGWNSSSYDCPKIKEISKKIGFVANHHTMGVDEETFERILSCIENFVEEKGNSGSNDGKGDNSGKPEKSWKPSIVGWDILCSAYEHLDYLQLYRNFSQGERPSYTLEAIALEELGTTKEKFLDFRELVENSELFLKYSAKDTILLAELEKKLGYIQLANIITHDTLVPLREFGRTTFIVRNAIMMKLLERNKVIPDRLYDIEYMEKMALDSSDKAAGAFVFLNKKGYVEWVGNVDVVSLYPSIIRSLNISPEKIVGQLDTKDHTMKVLESRKNVIRNKAFNIRTDFFGTLEYHFCRLKEKKLRLYLIDPEKRDDVRISSVIKNSSEIWEEIVKNNYTISANGTIFSNDGRGVVPELLDQWFDERNRLKKLYTILHELADKGEVSIADLLGELSDMGDVVFKYFQIFEES